MSETGANNDHNVGSSASQPSANIEPDGDVGSPIEIELVSLAKSNPIEGLM